MIMSGNDLYSGLSTCLFTPLFSSSDETSLYLLSHQQRGQIRRGVGVFTSTNPHDNPLSNKLILKLSFNMHVIHSSAGMSVEE